MNGAERSGLPPVLLPTVGAVDADGLAAPVPPGSVDVTKYAYDPNPMHPPAKTTRYEEASSLGRSS